MKVFLCLLAAGAIGSIFVHPAPQDPASTAATVTTEPDVPLPSPTPTPSAMPTPTGPDLHGLSTQEQLLALGVITTVHDSPASSASPTKPSDCTPVMTEDKDPDVVDGLINDGWKGDPKDGREALYPPGCVN